MELHQSGRLQTPVGTHGPSEEAAQGRTPVWLHGGQSLGSLLRPGNKGCKLLEQRALHSSNAVPGTAQKKVGEKERKLTQRSPPMDRHRRNRKQGPTAGTKGKISQRREMMDASLTTEKESRSAGCTTQTNAGHRRHRGSAKPRGHTSARSAWDPTRLWPAPRPTDLRGSRGLQGTKPQLNPATLTVPGVARDQCHRWRRRQRNRRQSSCEEGGCWL